MPLAYHEDPHLAAGDAKPARRKRYPGSWTCIVVFSDHEDFPAGENRLTVGADELARGRKVTIENLPAGTDDSTGDSRPHARVFDLPGWPCPPRVRDIPDHEEGWGWIAVSTGTDRLPVVQDEHGYLWVNGDVVPAFRTPHEKDANPGALVFQVETGIGLWIHPRSLRVLPSINHADRAAAGQWLPVNEVAAERPSFIRNRLERSGSWPTWVR